MVCVSVCVRTRWRACVRVYGVCASVWRCGTMYVQCVCSGVAQCVCVCARAAEMCKALGGVRRTWFPLAKKPFYSFLE